MKLKVVLRRSPIGHPERHRKTLHGLGLRRLNQEKVLVDTPAVRGMVAQVSHLVDWSMVEE
jgi:large subunit ribosomal protein L30